MILSKVRNFKCFNQFANGDDFTLNLSDFTPNLVGNVNEKVKVAYDVSFDVFLSSSQSWQISSDGLTLRLYAPNIDLYNEGFRIGDTVLIDTSYSAADGFNTVTTVIITDFDLDNSVIEGDTAFSTSGTVSSAAILLDPPTLRGFNLRYGLVENNEDFEFRNK